MWRSVSLRRSTAAMQLCQARIAKNPRDTVALHALSVAYALRANYGFLVRKSWKASLYDSSQARKYDNRSLQLEPDNYDAKLLQGGYDYIVGNLTWSLRALGFIAGFHGDKQRGLRTIEEVAAKGQREPGGCGDRSVRSLPPGRAGDARYSAGHAVDPALSSQLSAAFRTGADVCLDREPQERSATRLSEIARLKQENAPGYERIPWEKIYYETGNLEFWFDDLDRALENLKKVTGTPAQLKELDLNTGVLALMRQGQIYDLQNRHDLAVKRYQQAVRFAPEAEAARESQHYINSPYTRPVRNQERG